MQTNDTQEIYNKMVMVMHIVAMSTTPLNTANWQHITKSSEIKFSQAHHYYKNYENDFLFQILVLYCMYVTYPCLI